MSEDRRRAAAPKRRKRLAKIRRRLARGFYDDPEILGKIVRRILASGDL